MKKIIVIMAVLAIAGTANAATEAEKDEAITAGLEWLAQNRVGGVTGTYWSGPEAQASTGAAILAFVQEGYAPGDDVIINGTSYGDVVGGGLEYLTDRVLRMNIGMQTYGNPDTNANGYGAHWSNNTYITGIAICGLAEAIGEGGLSGATITTGGAYNGRTYGELLQDTVDYCAFGQNEGSSPGPRGGWRYGANSSLSDNSTAQWPPTAMMFAAANGAATPASGFVQDENAMWIDYIQNMAVAPGTGIHGSSGYDNPWNMNNVSKTGGLLTEMVFAGDDPSGNVYTATDAAGNFTNPNLLAAIDYLDRQWQTSASSWNGNFNSPYAMWSAYKGLESTIGLDDTTYITNLRNQATARGGLAASIDADDTWNWWEDYCEWLWNDQNDNGSWDGYGSWYGPLATAWHINILAATEIPHEDVPVPAAFLLGSIGLAVSSWRLRRRKEL